MSYKEQHVRVGSVYGRWTDWLSPRWPLFVSLAHFNFWYIRVLDTLYLFVNPVTYVASSRSAILTKTHASPHRVSLDVRTRTHEESVDNEEDVIRTVGCTIHAMVLERLAAAWTHWPWRPVHRRRVTWRHHRSGGGSGRRVTTGRLSPRHWTCIQSVCVCVCVCI